MNKHVNRRRFLRRSAGLAAGFLALPRTRSARAAQGGAASHAIRLGGPVSAGSSDPEAIAQAHRRLGYRAAFCPFGNDALNDSARLRAAAEAFAKHDVAIAEVGRWVNLMDADPARRKANLENVTQGLALAEAVGARCCVDIAGSFSTEQWYGPHPKNFSEEFFDLAVENARKIIDAVKPARTKFCYEMMGWAYPEGPDSYLRLIRAIDREAFGVHLDPCNGVNSPERFYRNAEFISECFDKLGPHIVSCHAKDLQWQVEMNVHFVEVRPGAGAIDYRPYLQRLAALRQEPPLMLEHLPNAEEYDKARRYLLELGPKVGVRFE